MGSAGFLAGCSGLSGVSNHGWTAKAARRPPGGRSGGRALTLSPCGLKPSVPPSLPPELPVGPVSAMAGGAFACAAAAALAGGSLSEP